MKIEESILQSSFLILHFVPSSNFYEQVYAVVRRIPRGKVTSYGRVARMLGRPRAARAVGYALNALPDMRKDLAFETVPWQRVVNRIGHISVRSKDATPSRQAELLRNEGVAVDDELHLTNFQADLWQGLSLAELDKIINH